MLVGHGKRYGHASCKSTKVGYLFMMSCTKFFYHELDQLTTNIDHLLLACAAFGHTFQYVVVLLAPHLEPLQIVVELSEHDVTTPLLLRVHGILEMIFRTAGHVFKGQNAGQSLPDFLKH